MFISMFVKLDTEVNCALIVLKFAEINSHETSIKITQFFIKQFQYLLIGLSIGKADHQINPCLVLNNFLGFPNSLKKVFYNVKNLLGFLLTLLTFAAIYFYLFNLNSNFRFSIRKEMQSRTTFKRNHLITLLLGRN
jgi:hypothetical protein